MFFGVCVCGMEHHFVSVKDDDDDDDEDKVSFKKDLLNRGCEIKSRETAKTCSLWACFALSDMLNEGRNAHFNL